MKWFRKPFRKRIQNNDSEGSQENNEEDARNISQRPERAKEQTEINDTLEGVNSWVTEAEEQINDLEDKTVEIIAAEQNIEKRIKKKEESLRDLWDNIKYTSIHIIGVPEEKTESTWENTWRDNSWKHP